MTKKFWDDETEAIVIQKNDRGEEIHVKRTKKNSKMYTDVRTWYPNDDGDLQPGKGISIPDDLADEVAEAILEAHNREFGSTKKSKKSKK